MGVIKNAIPTTKKPQVKIMRWITDEEEFDKIMLDARSCVYMDSGRVKTELQRLQFDHASLRTDQFSLLLRTLMEWSKLKTIYFTVLDPDPYDYFFHRFNMYPSFEIEDGDFPDPYIEALSKPYSNQLGFDLGTVYWEHTITAPGIPWFIHSLRSPEDNGGHLWVPKGWPEKIFKFDKRFIEAW